MTAGPIVMRTSERTSLKRCPQRWYWAWRMGLQPKQIDTKLWFGTGIHVALAEWYKPGTARGPHPAETWLKFVSNEERYIRDSHGLIDQDRWIDARDLGMAMLLEYVEHYSAIDDKLWFIATEQSFEASVKVSDNLTIIYSGTFDGVFRDESGRLWLIEHKTAANMPNTGYLELDNQAGSYFAFAEIVLKHKGIMRADEQLEGIMYNFLRKGMPDDRPIDGNGRRLNKDGGVSKNQPKPLFMRHTVWRSQRQRINTINAIKSDAKLAMAYRSKQLPVTKTPTKDCQWDCQFFQMCQLHEQGEDWIEFKEAMYDQHDPYEDHRMSLKDAGL